MEKNKIHFDKFTFMTLSRSLFETYWESEFDILEKTGLKPDIYENLDNVLSNRKDYFVYKNELLILVKSMHWMINGNGLWTLLDIQNISQGQKLLLLINEAEKNKINKIEKSDWY